MERVPKKARNPMAKTTNIMPRKGYLDLIQEEQLLKDVLAMFLSTTTMELVINAGVFDAHQKNATVLLTLSVRLYKIIQNVCTSILESNVEKMARLTFKDK